VETVAAEVGELAARVVESTSPNAWFALIVDGEPEDAAERMLAEVAALSGPAESAARRVTVATSRELAFAARDHADGVLLVTLAAAFTLTEWAHADLNRSRLQRTGATVLVLSPAAAAQLENHAPNLASWVGGSMWRLVGARPLDAAEVELRLAAMRAHTAMSDEEVVRLAETAQLPADPEFAEWLALLGRGDLVGERS
jgi:hypothetical protein